MIHQPACSAARAAVFLLHPLALLIVGLVSWPADWDGIHAVLDSARSAGPSIADREDHVLGYYDWIISGPRSPKPGGSHPEVSTRPGDRPDGRISFKEADVIRYLDDDFLQFELKPRVSRTLFGQPFVTNEFGMHDDQVTLEKPEGTFRIAVLGASMDMGWGVRYQDTYANRLQEWLGARATERGHAGPRRFEVLNFAVMAYSPLQRLDTLRRKVLAFRPDMVIYSATTLDVRLTEIHLCDMLPKRVDLHYDFLKQVVTEAKVAPKDLRVDAEGRLLHKEWLKAKLEPFYWSLYDQTLGRIAAECRLEGVPLAMVIIPRVGLADSPGARAEPVARLKAMADHHGVTVFDLSDTFDRFDPTTLEIATWDDHPNAVGHQRLFLALAREIVADSSLCQRFFPGESFTPREPGPASPDEVGDRGTRPAPTRPKGFVADGEAGHRDETRGKVPAFPQSSKRAGQG
jgi:hypothetical protein